MKNVMNSGLVKMNKPQRNIMANDKGYTPERDKKHDRSNRTAKRNW